MTSSERETAIGQLRQRARDPAFQMSADDASSTDPEVVRQRTNRQTVLSELRSGKIKPKNCAEFQLAHYASGSIDAPVMTIALQPPQGLGFWSGRVTGIDKQRVISLGDIPESMFGIVVVLNEDSVVYGSERVKAGAQVSGFGRQTEVMMGMIPTINVRCLQVND